MKKKKLLINNWRVSLNSLSNTSTMLICCWLLVLHGILLTAPSFAQLQNSARIELAKDLKDDEAFDVTNLEHDGVLVTAKQENYFSGKDPVWKFTKYDVNLKERWKAEMKIRSGINPLLSYHNQQALYWLFGEPDDSPVISIFKIDLETGVIDEIEGKLLVVNEVSHFKVLGNTAFIGGKYRDRPVVAMFRFFDKSTQVLPSLYVNNLELIDLDVDEMHNEVRVVSHTTTRKSGCKLAVKTYNYEGKLLTNVDFPTEQDKSLITGSLIKLNNEESLLVGNYSIGCTSYSVGLYVTKIKGSETFPIKFIEFANMENFFNYMKPSRLQKVKEKIARKQEEGKEIIFRYMLNVHDLIPTNDGLVMVAEAFFPQYKNTTTSSYNPLIRPNLDRAFEGFRYTHAIICGFDRQGNFLWDNNFTMQDLSSDKLSEQVQATILNDRLILAYPSEGKINTQIIRGNQVLKEKENFDLKTTYENDKVLYAANASLAAWYDRYFLAWGVQKIQNTKDITNNANPEREVFYLSKLSYVVKE